MSFVSFCLQGRWLLSVVWRSLFCVTGAAAAAGCHGCYGNGWDAHLRAALPGDPVAAAGTSSLSGAELLLAVLSVTEMS